MDRYVFYQDGDNWYVGEVVKEGDDMHVDELFNHHANEKAARSHVRALNANEGSKAWKYTQAEAAYNPLSAKRGEACANCRWFEKDYYDGGGHRCTVVQDWPIEILPTGHSNQWQLHPALEEPTPLTAEPVPVYIVDEPKSTEVLPIGKSAAPDKNPVTVPQTVDQRGTFKWFDDLRDFIEERILGKPKVKIFGVDVPATGFKVNEDGTWLAWWTTPTQDRDKQWFSTWAIDEYLKAVEEGEWDYPELWFSHIAGTRHGQAKAMGRVDYMVYAVGEFDASADKEYINYYQQAKGLTVSHGFLYNPNTLIDDTYYWFRTFEISPLHETFTASNRYTGFALDSTKEHEDTTMNDKQRDALRHIGMSDERIAAIEQEGAAGSRQIEDAKERVKAGEGSNPTDEKGAEQEGRLAALETGLRDVVKRLDDRETAQKTADEADTKWRTEMVNAMNAQTKAMQQFMGLAPRASKDQSANMDEENQKGENIPDLMDLNNGGPNSAKFLTKIFPFGGESLDQEGER